MKSNYKFSFIALLIWGLLFITGQTEAQNSCDLTGFVTYTQGGWGSPSNSAPGTIRDQNFSNVFPDGLTIGTQFTAKFTTALAVKNFMPQGGTAGAFTQNYTDPTTTSAGVLAGQMAALAMNMGYNKAGKLGQNTLRLEDLVISSGDFSGMSVRELFALINKALGGEQVGYTFSQLNHAATLINENFDNGTVDKKFLTCPSASASLGDRVWFDSNNNGIQDGSEAGIPDVTVELHKCSDNSLLSSVKTNSTGLYLFSNLPAGDYYVVFVAPAGYTISQMSQGTDQARDSNPDQNGKTDCITLTDGEHNLTIDAGLFTKTNADLSVVKTVSKTNPECGENITYTVLLTNNGPDKVQNIEVGDLLPEGLAFGSYSATSGTYNNTTGVWAVTSLNNGATATLTITVNVDCSVFNNNTVDLGPAKGYNLFVLENISQPSSDTEGKVAVGGDAYFSGYSVGDKLPPNSGDVLIVDGTLTFMSGQIFNGNVVYGTSTNLPRGGVSIEGGILRQGHPIDFTEAKTYLQSLSSSLANYGANGSTTFAWGKLELNGSDPFLNVFSVSGADLSTANNFEVNAPNGSVVVVNVSGTDDKWSGGVVINGTSNALTLFNFFEAQKITIQGIDLRGTLLAPLADLSFPAGLISGQAIVKSMNGSGQFNNVMFIGNIPVLSTITNVAGIVSDNSQDPASDNNSSSVSILAEYQHYNGSESDEENSGSNTGTNNWQNVSSFGAGEIIYTMVYKDNEVYAGTWGGHIYKSADGAKTWETINSGMNAHYIWSLTFSNNVLFAATEKGLYSYNGTTWTATALADMDVHALLSSNGVLYAGTWGSGIFKSTDNGLHWTDLNKGLELYPAIQSLTADHNGNLFAGTASGGIFKSSNGGTDWTNANCEYLYIWTLSSTPGAIFAGTYGGGLYRSPDGTSWTKLNSMPSLYVYSLTVDGSGKLYASSWTNGVFTSTDNGDTWTPLGLGGQGVSSVLVNPGSSELFAGTNTGRVFLSIAHISGVEDKSAAPTSFSLSQNYPNPFNPATSIEFAVPVNGMYSLKVYDMLGKEVAILVSGELNAGNYKMNFNANSLSSGIYIYRLSGDRVNIVRKMMLMK